MVNRKLEYILEHWVCKRCKHINDTFKKHRKRKEAWKTCAKCGEKKPIRAI